MNPETGKHHAQYPGFWIHPDKGAFEIAPDEHHSDFFAEHPELFGNDLNAAYETGWISIRRWVGEQETWALRYHALESASPTLSSWAANVIERWPSEAEVQVLGIPGTNEPRLYDFTLAQTKNGKLALVLEGRRQAVTDWNDYEPSLYVTEKYQAGGGLWLERQAYRPCRRAFAYIEKLREYALSHEAELPHGMHHQHMVNGYIPQHMLEETGGSVEALHDAIIMDQAEFDAVAVIPWVPKEGSWASFCAGGLVKIPDVSTLVEVIDYVQKDYRGQFGRYGLVFRQPGIRDFSVSRGEKAQVVLHRPCVDFTEHRRLVKTGWWAGTTPEIEMEIAPPS